MKIIAEGVETAEELKILIHFGVDYVQGYYLGMPETKPQQLKIEQIEELLKFNKKIKTVL